MAISESHFALARGSPMIHRFLPWLLAVLAFAARAQAPTILAAASLKDALDDVALMYRSEYDVKPTIAYGSSAALARQIESGAPADLFISADLDWMDYV